jgi:hypothetical protein
VRSSPQHVETYFPQVVSLPAAGKPESVRCTRALTRQLYKYNNTSLSSVINKRAASYIANAHSCCRPFLLSGLLLLLTTISGIRISRILGKHAQLPSIIILNFSQFVMFCLWSDLLS